MLKRYFDFKDNLNENVQQAKAFMKNTALRAKKAKMSDGKELSEEELKKIGLDQMEVRQAENNPEFLKIKDLVKDNPGYTYLFTKFYFEDLVDLEPNQRMEDIKGIYNTLRDVRQSLSQCLLIGMLVKLLMRRRRKKQKRKIEK